MIKKFIFLTILISLAMLVTYLTELFVNDYFLNINNIQEILK